MAGGWLLAPNHRPGPTTYNPVMWPKAFSQLVELAPHITRLLPLADRYFKDKSSSDEATRKTLEEMQASHRASSEKAEASPKGMTSGSALAAGSRAVPRNS